jgi:hypothetical protein
MRGESDLVVLADVIAKLQDDLVLVPAEEDRTEIEALLEIARDAYKVIKARLENSTGRPLRRGNRPSHSLQ